MPIWHYSIEYIAPVLITGVIQTLKSLYEWKKTYLVKNNVLITVLLFEHSLQEIHEICHSITFNFMQNSFSDTSRKGILPNMIKVEPA